MENFNDKKILIVNFCTNKGTGLDVYAKIWKDVYTHNITYINFLDINEFKNDNYWETTIKYFIGTYNKHISFLSKLINEKEIDLIHITDTPIYNYFIVNELVKIFPNKKIIYTMHDPIPHVEKTISKKILRLLLKYLNYRTYELSKKFQNFFIHVHSKKMLPFNWYSNNIIIQQHPLVKVNNVENLFSIDTQKIIFTFVGRLEYYKGINIFIDTIKSLEKELSLDLINKATFIIAGRGAMDFSLLDNSIFDIKIINKFLSEEEFDSIIKYSNAIILPYIEATQSGVLAKALYAEKFCIVSNKGALSDFIIDGISGYIIEPKLEDLEAKIKPIIEGKVNISSFDDGIKTIKETFKTNTIKKNFLKRIYENN